MEYFDEIASITRNKRNKKLFVNNLLGLIIKLILITLLIYILFSEVVIIARISGNDTYPYVRDGDLVLGIRLQTEYEFGDVVIFKNHGKNTHGRIYGRENDVINIQEDGKVIINGTDHTRESFYLTDPKKGLDYPYVVSNGNYFILNDHRVHTHDSRDFGAINEQDIVGKVIAVFSRRGF